MDCSLLSWHSSSWFFNCGLGSLVCSSSVWSPSLILFFTNALALPVTALLLHSHFKQDCISSELPASGRFGRQEGRLRCSHVVLVPMLCCLPGASLSQYNLRWSTYWLLLFDILPLEQGSCCSRFSLSQAIVASGGGLIPHFFSQQTF